MIHVVLLFILCRIMMEMSLKSMACVDHKIVAHGFSTLPSTELIVKFFMLQYLDEYLDTIVSLPNDLQRHYSLLKQLDSSSSSLLSSIIKQMEPGEETNEIIIPSQIHLKSHLMA